MEPSFCTKGQKGLFLKKGKGLNKRQTFQMEANELKIKILLSQHETAAKSIVMKFIVKIT